LFSPVLLEAGGIFVERGFVREEDVSRVVTPAGQVSITGVLRAGVRGNAYTPDNEPSSDVWYWPDLKVMADTMMMRATNEQYYVAQSQVDPLATGTPSPNPYSDRKGAAQIPAERHLGYAATWWGFGIALVGVYIGMHVRAGRLRFGRTPLK
jgi:surfeit locus 1 family protein